MPKLNTIEPEYREFFKLLMEKAKMYRDMGSRMVHIAKL